MNFHRGRSKFVFLALFLLASARVWAGPPFQTDDPEPVDFRHYEFYQFGTVSSTPVETDPTGPAFEFNWGVVPNVQLHVILPWGAILPSNNPVYLPGGVGPSAYGLTDMELGAKVRFIKETQHRPEIGSFTMLELPTGSYSQGLGVGRVWYKLPIWVQKSWGHWTTYGGAGYQIVHQTQSATMVDLGGFYYFKNPGLQLLFCYGHSVVGQTENYAYLGLYQTWGSKPGHGLNGFLGRHF